MCKKNDDIINANKNKIVVIEESDELDLAEETRTAKLYTPERYPGLSTVE